MTACVSDMMKLMEMIAPPDLAEDWDNIGLQVGDRNWPVRRVGIALDATRPVLETARKTGVDMIITHHPLIFRPLRAIDCHTPVGSIIEKAITHQIAIYAAHTNYDKTHGGLNDILADRIGLSDCTVLEDISNPERPAAQDLPQGIGRVGSLPQALELKVFAVELKRRLNLDALRIAGRPDLLISRAAICTGSGSSLVNAFLTSGAQVFISGDLRFHDARDIEAADLAMIDIGHFPSEYIMVEALVDRLTQLVTDKYPGVTVDPCGTEIDPFVSV